MKHLCVDIGATKTLIRPIDKGIEGIIKVSTENFFKNLKRYLDYDTKKITLAVPGPIDTENGIIHPPNLPEESIHIRKLLEPYFEDITIINDCHAGVIGEYVYGDISTEDMVYLTISTGVGAGVISRGKLLKGYSGNFAEVGHMKIGDDTPCRCGGTGHWESYASGKNLPRYARSLTGVDYEGPEKIFTDYREGEPNAKKVIDEMNKYNAIGVSNLINLYDPSLIVIGGSVALNNPDIIIEPLEKNVKKEAVNPLPEIRKASLEDLSVIEGLRAICTDDFSL